MDNSALAHQRFWSKVQKGPGCWEWKGATGNGYGVVVQHGRNRQATHVAMEMTTGQPVPPGCIVMHICDNPICVRPDHLRVATQKDNIRDMHSKGRGGYYAHPGEKNSHAKLTRKDVEEIRALASQGRLTFAQIAEHYGVDPSTVGDISRRKTWKHI